MKNFKWTELYFYLFLLGIGIFLGFYMREVEKDEFFNKHEAIYWKNKYDFLVKTEAKK